MVTKFDIDKFDGKISFAIWKVHMQAVLMHHGYKKALRGITHKPQILREVIHETIAAGLWLKFESLYMTKSLANKLRLKDRLYTFRMKPGTSVQDHLDEFNTILIDLKNLDVDIDDEDKVVLLVISLPASYKHFKEIILYGNRKTLSVDDVKSALLSKQKYNDDVEPESGEGLVARGRSSDRGESSNKYKNIDHNLVENIQIRVLKNKLEREGKGNNEKKHEKAAEVAIAKGDPDDDVYLAIDTKKSRDELIVDSGCTFHMIPHRSWFTTYELFNGGNVYMGNHSICPVIGKSNIQVKMHADAIQSGGLYVLQGTVVYGSTGVATSKASLEDSKLWHYRLGHMGKKGMKNLAKKEREMLLTTFILIYGGHLLLRLEEYGIARHHTLVRTPQQNGVAERMNSTIMEKVRCMLSQANLDKDFWVEAATTASYLINSSPHRSLDGNIPEILWSSNSVDYSNLGVFGCPVYVHVNEEKLVPRAVKCIFLGYGSRVKGYRVWCPDPKYRKIIHSRDVTFNEDVIINSGKDFVPPHNVNNNHIEAYIENYKPTNYLEAISSTECDKWVVAMEEEVESLHKNETWELVKLPKEKRVISCKWLLKVKDGIPGAESNQYKARYVVRGFDQREGIDFNKVFSPVVRHTSTRVLLFIVALQDLELEQLDVKTTFLHGHLEWNFSLFAPHFKLSSHECPKSEEDKEDTSRVPYSSAVGSLMYAMVCTRPDLAHVVSVVSRYMHNPGKMRWEAVKCILRYLKGTSNIGLSFKKGCASPNGVVGYVDFDYAGDLDARKSLSLYIFSHYGSAISWYSSLQAITPLSTT
nr:retrovirus-related Pol polyprotein from transposon TNT 1-94 [Tanacetum cinerariifolium]